MVEIQVERTSSSATKAWAIIALVLVALLGAGWYFTMGPGATTRPDLPGAMPSGPSPEPPAAPTTGAEGAVEPAPPAAP
jgi:hypothetical protein